MVEIEHTRTRIRSAAVDLFAERGYDQASLREIADRVGITKASLYYHYPSKQALLLDVLAPLTTGIRSTVDEAEQLPRTRENLRNVLGRMLDVMLDNRDTCRLLERDLSSVLSALEPVWGELVKTNMRLHAWLTGPDAAPATQVRAAAALDVLGVSIKWAGYLPDVPADVFRVSLLDAALAALDA